MMERIPEKCVEKFDDAYQRAANRLVKEFINEFCIDDGSIVGETGHIQFRRLLSIKYMHIKAICKHSFSARHH